MIQYQYFTHSIPTLVMSQEINYFLRCIHASLLTSCGQPLTAYPTIRYRYLYLNVKTYLETCLNLQMIKFTWERIKRWKFLFGYWNMVGWLDGHVHIFFSECHPLLNYGAAHGSYMDLSIHYQTIFWQPNENVHLLFSDILASQQH